MTTEAIAKQQVKIQAIETFGYDLGMEYFKLAELRIEQANNCKENI